MIETYCCSNFGQKFNFSCNSVLKSLAVSCLNLKLNSNFELLFWFQCYFSKRIQFIFLNSQTQFVFLKIVLQRLRLLFLFSYFCSIFVQIQFVLLK